MDDGTSSWSEILGETIDQLSGHVESAEREARWLLEEVSGLDGADWIVGRDDPATQRAVARLDAMVQRRLAGEPIQYVLGHWPFRSLDLLCDRRVLIPRPETEHVVEIALGELDKILMSRHGGHRPVVVDLGTGSGAIALSVAAERNGCEVWAVDASEDALAVARANVVGLGMAGGRVRLLAGSWFDPLPADLRGHVDMIISNPPYVGTEEDLDPAVRDWEPAVALTSGRRGLDSFEVILAAAPEWLAEDGILVAEIGSGQGEDVAAIARRAGFSRVEVLADHAGLDRVLVAARRPTSSDEGERSLQSGG